MLTKLVLVYEDIVEESGEDGEGRRYRLTGKRYFCGLYSGKDNEKQNGLKGQKQMIERTLKR